MIKGTNDMGYLKFICVDKASTGLSQFIGSFNSNLS